MLVVCVVSSTEHTVSFYAGGRQDFYAVQLPVFDVKIKETQCTRVEV